MQKNTKKVKNGGKRDRERRGKIEEQEIEREKREDGGTRDREREEGRWRTCYWFVEAVRPMLFCLAAITRPFGLCVSIYILFENNNNNKCGHYLFGLIYIYIYLDFYLFSYFYHCLSYM